MTRSLSCFWSLLDISSFNFLYVSPAIPDDIASNFLIARSLFDLVHPEEAALARSDLTAFVNERSLGGSITRCRLRNVFEPDGPFETRLVCYRHSSVCCNRRYRFGSFSCGSRFVCAFISLCPQNKIRVTGRSPRHCMWRKNI
ncbi:hypothetical protein BX666DRAFT_853895 [Dichotomocladium elegans]|nr:hypothetical protein BX666DRAFT_853895 [Dichotomocladium elegans]